MSRNTRKDNEAARQQLTDLINREDLTQEQVLRARQMQDYLTNMRNYSTANPRNNATMRDFETEAYNNAYNYILNGSVPTAGAVKGTANIFNGENHREVLSDAGSVFHDTFTKKGSGASNLGYYSGSSETDGASSGKSSEKFFFEWNKGLDPSFAKNKDFKTRATDYINQLIKNFQEALDTKNKRYGIKTDTLNKLPEYIDALQAIDVNGNAVDVVNAIGNVVSNFTPTADSLFKYFEGVMPVETAAEKAKKALLAQGYTEEDLSSQPEYVRNLLRQKGINLMRDANGLHAFDKNYAGYTAGLSDINDDWQLEGIEGGGYGTGIMIDADGNVYIGDEAGAQNSTFKDQWNKYQSQRRADLDGLTHWWNVNRDSYQNGDNRTFEIVADYLKQDFRGEDVSRLFKGDEKVIAVNKDNIKGEIKKDAYGNLRLNQAKFYVVDSAGNVVEKTWDELKGSYDRSGITGESSQQAGVVNNFADQFEGAESTIDPNADIFGRSYWQAAVGGESGWDKLYIGGLGLIGNAIRYGSWDNINEDPATFTKALLDAIQSPNGRINPKYTNISSGIHTNAKLLSNLDYVNKKYDYAVFLYKLFQEKPGLWDQLTPQQKQTAKALFKSAITANAGAAVTGLEKNGGIIYAAKGTSLKADGTPVNDKYKTLRQKAEQDVEGTDKAETRAREEGYRSLHDKNVNKSTKLTTSDILRFTTIAQDAASLVASFTGPVGSLAAGALGVTSMGTDLIADIMDEGMSAGEVAKNALINTGFAALGMLPGGKTPKIVKQIVKWAPKALTAIAGTALATDESVQNTFKKIGDGTTKFNHEDWRNITRVFQLAAGVGRGAHQDYHNIRAKVKYKNKGTGNFEVKIGNTTKTISKTDNDSFTKALQEGKKEDAIKILTKAGFGKRDAEAVIADHSKINIFKKGESKFNGEISEKTSRPEDAMKQEWDSEQLKMDQSLSNIRPGFRQFLTMRGLNPALTAKQRALLNMGYEPVYTPAKTNLSTDEKKNSNEVKGALMPPQDSQPSRSQPSATNSAASVARDKMVVEHPANVTPIADGIYQVKEQEIPGLFNESVTRSPAKSVRSKNGKIKRKYGKVVKADDVNLKEFDFKNNWYFGHATDPDQLATIQETGLRGAIENTGVNQFLIGSEAELLKYIEMAKYGGLHHNAKGFSIVEIPKRKGQLRAPKDLLDYLTPDEALTHVKDLRIPARYSKMAIDAR